MRVDVHAHYWPAVYLDALVAEGRSDLVRAGRQADDFDHRLRVMDDNEVGLQLLSAIGLNTEVGHAAGAARAARTINDEYTRVARQHPGRFGVLASVPLPFVDEALVEVDRAYDELGAVGIALPCVVGGRGIDDPVYDEFWAALAARDALVYVHPVGSDSAAHPGLAEWGLHTAFGSPTQIAVAPVRVLFSGLSTRHPTLRFVFAMGAGTLPYLWPRLERNLRRGFEMSSGSAVGGGYFDWVLRLPVEPADPLAGLRSFWYDVAIQDIPASLAVARDTYGVDRLLLGSDEIFASLTDAVRFVEDSPYLSDAEKVAVLDHNAARLLGDDVVARLAGATT